mmetsp:Transcript_9181/g.37705  ORF Transcript_9181/g.37705 Transcript_9181/m.37705 type:complete len:401 (+) Transcript_9181:787-1989(+)
MQRSNSRKASQQTTRSPHHSHEYRSTARVHTSSPPLGSPRPVPLGRVDEGRDVGLGRHLEHAVAEVEDVAVPRAAGFVDARLDGVVDDGGIVGEQQRGFDVALHGHVRAEHAPRVREVALPVDREGREERFRRVVVLGRRRRVRRDHVFLVFDVRRPAVGEEDDRDVRMRLPHRFRDAQRVGLGEELEVVGRDVVGPRLEDLDDLRAAVGLVHRIRSDRVGHRREEAVRERRVRVHHRLDAQRVPRRAALDRVGRERPRRADEADERRLALGLAAQVPERLAHEGELRRRVEARRGALEGRDARVGPERVADGGALGGHDVEVDAERGQHGENVREHDDAVHAEGAPALQRQLRRDLGRLGPHAEGVVVGELAELGHVAARLPHEPHRRALRLLAARRAD